MATTEGQSPKKLEKKAAAKEEIVNATSGARETVDHAVFNARAVGKILLHPFSKEAKADAISTAREDKAASGQKMSAIRQVGAQQADALRAAARGEDAPGSLPRSDAPGSLPHSDAPGSSPHSDAPGSLPRSKAGEDGAPASIPVSTPAPDGHDAKDTAAEPVSEDRDRV